MGFVVNYDFPYEAEDYVHRIGRTGRAGQQGTAISFADEDESFIIPEIEEFIGESLKCTLLMGNDPLMTEIPRHHHGHGHSRPDGESASRESVATATSGVAAEPVDKTSDESGEKPVEKPAEEPAEKPADEPAEEPVEKQPVEESVSEQAEPEKEKDVAGDRKPEDSAQKRSGSKPVPDKREIRSRPAGAHSRRPTHPKAAPVAGKPPPAGVQRRPRFSDEWVPGE